MKMFMYLFMEFPNEALSCNFNFDIFVELCQRVSK